MRFCMECDEEVTDSFSEVGNGWEGLTICDNCGMVEGDTYEDDEGREEA